MKEYKFVRVAVILKRKKRRVEVQKKRDRLVLNTVEFVVIMVSF